MGPKPKLRLYKPFWDQNLNLCSVWNLRKMGKKKEKKNTLSLMIVWFYFKERENKIERKGKLLERGTAKENEKEKGASKILIYKKKTVNFLFSFYDRPNKERRIYFTSPPHYSTTIIYYRSRPPSSDLSPLLPLPPAILIETHQSEYRNFLGRRQSQRRR